MHRSSRGSEQVLQVKSTSGVGHQIVTRLQFAKEGSILFASPRIVQQLSLAAQFVEAHPELFPQVGTAMSFFGVFFFVVPNQSFVLSILASSVSVPVSLLAHIPLEFLSALVSPPLGSFPPHQNLQFQRHLCRAQFFAKPAVLLGHVSFVLLACHARPTRQIVEI